MAEKKKKAVAKGKKPSGGRIKKWFVNIITELKRVIWTDKKKLRQSTMTVLLIIAISVVIILVFDTVVSFIMRTTGLYSTKEQPAESLPLPNDDNVRRESNEMGQMIQALGVRVFFEG